MRKKFLLGATTVLAATAAYMGVDAHSRSSQTSTLQLANIEALSDNTETETLYLYVTDRTFPGGIPGYVCAGKGNRHCPDQN